MSISMFISNLIFCSIAFILLFLSLSEPGVIKFGKVMPLSFITLIILLKLFAPFEFSFTYTFASEDVRPKVNEILNYQISSTFKLKNLLLIIWICGTLYLFLRLFFIYYKTVNILNMVSSYMDNIAELPNFKYLSKEFDISHYNIIQQNMPNAPFVIGMIHPTIVLPDNLSSNECTYTLAHELAHCKHHHLIIKIFLEIVICIYWWNPLLWIIKRTLIHVLEVRADIFATKILPANEFYAYIETLIKFSKSVKFPTQMHLPFSFANNQTIYRAKALLSLKNSSNSKLLIRHFLLLGISLIFVLLSCFIVIEPYKIDPQKTAGTFSLNQDTSYFLKTAENNYELYSEDKYIMSTPSIPDDLSYLEIRIY